MDADKKDAKSIEHLSSADYYFNSYAHFGIHEEMLKDEVRTKSYRSAIINNRHLFKDKIVLDVGCGTGILSLFAAKAGAKKVIAVDFSNIANQAKQIVKDNGFDHVITVVQGKIEDVNMKDYGVNEKEVDVIISEWMGYCLLYESMFNSVLYARDKWMRPGGIMMPDVARLYICGIEDAEYKDSKIHFWDNVYGFDMRCIKKLAMEEPLVDTVEGHQIMTSHQRVLTLDLSTVTAKDVDSFEVPFKLSASRQDFCHAFVVYFDVQFTKCHKTITLNTNPEAYYTHWKQTVFYLEDVLSMNKGETVSGTFSCKQNKKNPRDLDLEIHYKFAGSSDKVERTQQYFLR